MSKTTPAGIAPCNRRYIDLRIHADRRCVNQEIARIVLCIRHFRLRQYVDFLCAFHRNDCGLRSTACAENHDGLARWIERCRCQGLRECRECPCYRRSSFPSRHTTVFTAPASCASGVCSGKERNDRTLVRNGYARILRFRSPRALSKKSFTSVVGTLHKGKVQIQRSKARL